MKVKVFLKISKLMKWGGYILIDINFDLLFSVGDRLEIGILNRWLKKDRCFVKNRERGLFSEGSL